MATKKDGSPKPPNTHTIYHNAYAPVNIPTDKSPDSLFCTVYIKLSYTVFRLAGNGAGCYHNSRKRDESKHPERVSSILKKARLTKDGTQEFGEMTRTAVIRGLITRCDGSFLILCLSVQINTGPPASLLEGGGPRSGGGSVPPMTGHSPSHRLWRCQPPLRGGQESLSAHAV